MKKTLILTALCSFTLLHLQAQVTIKKTNERTTAENQNEPTFAAPADTKQKSSCCSTNPFTLTACSQSLLQSFKNLTASVGVSNCHPSLNYPTVSFAMPENCFSHQTTSASMVTYSSFYVPGISEFRVIWGATAASYAYYGACAPSPIIYPHPGGATENHVFGAKLIKQSDYRAFAGPVRNYNTMAAVPAMAPSDIKQIISVYLEEKGGYSDTNETADYNNLFSSKGIVVNVKLKSGTTVPCYIINNYDGAGTIYWKEKNPACIK